MRRLIVRGDGSWWPSSLKLLLPREILGFAGFSGAWRLDLSVMQSATALERIAYELAQDLAASLLQALPGA